MATPRKHWFRVADSIGQEPIPNDELATLLRLMAELNTRWARDGLTPEQACTILLRPGDLEALTGSGSLARARRIAHSLATHVSLTVDEVGSNTRLTWPKWAEFQQLASPKLPDSHPKDARESPPPQPPPQDARRKTQEEKTTRSARGADKSPPPDRLPPDEEIALAHWCRDTLSRPDLVPRLAGLVDACFTYHRAKGNRHASWYATAQTWIRNEAEGRFGTPRASPTGTGDALRDAALAAVERQDRERQRALASGGRR